ncbi:nitrate/nitrite transporter [Bacillus pumilus]|jgi:NNP family nitrate/nitrite transporter-like MFS transporter|uniref:nitrate/nitrite transporter n=1 Tax=Bacillus pumilus TaxID=1408 RepID=UPI00081FA125|nr:nitrate/nitrite transporter [Bacillus pumilus]AOC56523.1 MFS transporter [Bacillus pumilus]MBR0585897.1 NarK/NasA family nitrate transporter [Bacillus pumilus DW2J2]MBR0615700.1 NarK/NasA family nitrate transporter [Bacillus pumilus]MBR0623646.1 NarK/NasA family nitrate transporter [Bacillus pumilus]MCY7723876.1 NarK/NasA family nitrate transporter [Bacillus pumilus]
MKLSELKSSGHPKTLLSSFLYFDVSFMIWVLLGALGAFIAQDFALSTAEKGMIVAIPILSGSFFRIVLGLFTDRIGPKKTAVIGMLFTTIPLIWGFIAGTTLSELVLIGILLGVAGASFAVALPMASRWYPPHLQGVAMGIAGAGNSGTLISTLFGPRLAEIYGWHAVMGLALIPLSLVFLFFIFTAKNAPNQPAPKPLRSYFSVFQVKSAWFFCLLYAITFGGFVGLSSFLSIFFVDQYGISKIHAGDFVTLCVAAGSFFRPIGGLIADKIGGMKVLLGLFAVIGICLGGVSSLPALPLVITLLFTGMMCLGMGNGAVFQLVPQVFHKEIGIVTGIVGAAGGIGGFFLPNILGSLKEVTGSYMFGFLTISLFVLVVFICLVISQLKRKKVIINHTISES